MCFTFKPFIPLILLFLYFFPNNTFQNHCCTLVWFWMKIISSLVVTNLTIFFCFSTFFMVFQFMSMKKYFKIVFSAAGFQIIQFIYFLETIVNRHEFDVVFSSIKHHFSLCFFLKFLLSLYTSSNPSKPYTASFCDISHLS